MTPDKVATKGRSREELSSLANDVITNRIYMTNTKQGIEHSFGMVLHLLDEEAYTRLSQANPACFFADYADVSPMSVNGYPSFLSMSWLSQEEWEVFYPILEHKRKLLEEVPEEEKHDAR